MDFYLDHDVALNVTGQLRALGHHVVTSREQGQEEAGDFLQLLTAAQNNWVLVSHNRKDFQLLHRAWVTWSRAWSVQAVHAGVLILPHGRPADSAGRLHAFATRHTVPLRNEMHRCSARGAWTRDDT